jgi:Domain of unknown function (DUF4337)
MAEPEEINESIEQITESLKEEKQREKWTAYIALSTALIAVIAAIVGLYGSQAASRSIIAKNEAVLYQNKASDAWAYYQAKGIKEDIYIVGAKANPHLAKELRAEAGRYNKEKEKVKKEAEALEGKVENSNKESDNNYERHHVFDYSETFLHIAIALAAISALTRSKPFWALSLLLSLIGIVVFGFGLAI